MNASQGTDLQKCDIRTFVPECWLMGLYDSCPENNSQSQDHWVKKAGEVGVMMAEDSGRAVKLVVRGGRLA